MNESTWKYVIKDMKKRNKTGIKKYGIPLNTTTTKDCLQELYEELLDAVVYLKTELCKRGSLQSKKQDKIIDDLKCPRCNGIPDKCSTPPVDPVKVDYCVFKPYNFSEK